MGDDKHIFQALLRTDLTAVARKCFETVTGGEAYHHNWHVDILASHLEAVRDGRTRRLLVSMPPRQLKSIMASVALPVMTLGLDPTAKIICLSYSEDLARKLTRDRRLCFESAWFRAAFPLARVDLKKNTEATVETAAGGQIFASSVGGTLTGIGADMIIIDDPMKAGDATSEAERTTVNRWFRETVVTRLNNKKTGRILIVAQRLHQDDLIGHVKELGAWEEICLPAIAPCDMDVESLDGGSFIWRAGAPLHPEREDLTALEEIRRMIGSRAFQAQYLQDPTPPEGDVIKLAWFGRYDHAPARGRYERVVQSWDSAIGATAQSDYSVCATWGILENRYYLLDVSRMRTDFPSLVKQVEQLAARYEPDLIMIEEAGGGRELLQWLRAYSDLPAKGIVPKGDKEARVARASGMIEAGRVLLPAEASWLAAFESEVAGFPNARHDDQVDAMSQFLNWTPTCKPVEITITSLPSLFGPARPVRMPWE